VGVLAVLGVSAVAFGYVTITKAINLTRLDRLERRNELLTRSPSGTSWCACSPDWIPPTPPCS
jgi:hypothetical protein